MINSIAKVITWHVAYTASTEIREITSVVILTPDILLCFNLSGAIHLDSDLLETIAVQPLGRSRRILEIESVYDVPVNIY